MQSEISLSQLFLFSNWPSQVLNKDLEDKEKQNAKVITQYQDTSERCEETERQKRQTLIELENTLKKLREVTREAEALGGELKETQQGLRESEHRREDIKGRAQDTVRQWVRIAGRARSYVCFLCVNHVGF